MRADHVGDVHPAVEQLVHLEVRVRIRRTNVVPVVGLGEEPRRAQHHAGQAVLAVHQLAQVLSGDLRSPVDVPRHGHHVLGDPRRRGARGRLQRPAERAGGAGEHEPADAGRDGLLEQHQRAADVRLDEVLTPVRPDVRLVQRRHVRDGLRAAQRLPDHSAVRHGSHHRRGRRSEHVESHDVVAPLAQHRHQRLAEVSGAARDQDPHGPKASSGASSRTGVVTGTTMTDTAVRTGRWPWGRS